MPEYTLFGGVNGQIFRFEIESGLLAEQQLDARAHGTFCDPCPDFFGRGRGCPRVRRCPWRHFRSKTGNLLVCKHYRNGLCKKTELTCDYLHTTDASKMPECFFFSRYGDCTNEDCPYRHVVPENPEENECPAYRRGFCAKGRRCLYKHTRKQACPCYLAGFCPDGPNCKFGHPSFDKPLPVKKGSGVDKFGFGRNRAPPQGFTRGKDGAFASSALPMRRRR